MTLHDYLSFMEEGDELTVWDTDYITESYFYAHKHAEDSWDNSMIELSKLLTVKKIDNHGGVEVNLSEVIENHLENLKKADLFAYKDIDTDYIMEDIDMILAGNVSESWLEKFVKALGE